MRQVRGAQRSEYDQIEALLERSFGADEVHLWQHLVRHDATLEPSGCRVAVVDGQIVALTVAMRRRIRTRHDWVDGAIITLVACDPAYERQGHGGAAVLDALDYCRRRDWRVGVLYGIPEFYPRLGFVPVLPRLETDLATAAVFTAGPGEPAEQPAGLTEAMPADAGELLQIYDSSLGRYPLAVERSAEPWVWRYRQDACWLAVIESLAARVAATRGHPRDEYWRLRADHPSSVLVWRSAQRQAVLRGYARLEPQPDDKLMVIPEAAVRDAADAPSLLAALLAAAANIGADKLRLVLPPAEPLVLAARVAGAEQHYRPARAGMAAVVDWAGILPEGYTVCEDSAAAVAAGGRVTLSRHGREVMRLPRPVMVGLALGYRSAAEAWVTPGLEWLGMAAARTAIGRDFGPAYPRWTLAPHW